MKVLKKNLQYIFPAKFLEQYSLNAGITKRAVFKQLAGIGK
jgi:hypothetical protein